MVEALSRSFTQSGDGLGTGRSRCSRWYSWSCPGPAAGGTPDLRTAEALLQEALDVALAAGNGVGRLTAGAWLPWAGGIRGEQAPRQSQHAPPQRGCGAVIARAARCLGPARAVAVCHQAPADTHLRSSAAVGNRWRCSLVARSPRSRPRCGLLGQLFQERGDPGFDSPAQDDLGPAADDAGDRDNALHHAL
jgi:hypothetical protein